MNRRGPLLAFVMLVIAAVVFWLTRPDPDAAGAGGDAGLLTPAGPDAAPDAPAAGPDAAARPGPAGAATPATAPDADPSAATGPDTDAWVPADATLDGRAAIACTVLLAPGVPAMGAVATCGSTGSVQGFSDQLGHLWFGRLDPGQTWRVEIGFPGYTSVVREHITVRAGAVTNLGTIDLGRDGRGPIAEVAVTVRASGGAPLAEARVVLTTVRPYGLYLAFKTDGRPGELSVEATTGADGTAVFRGLRPATYDVLAIAAGHALGVRPNLRIARDSTERVTITVPPGLHIAGHVTLPGGEPAVGVAVIGLNASAGFKTYPPTTTDETGAFTLDGLDGGGYMVLAYLEGYSAAQQMGVRAGAEDVALQLGVAAHLQGRLVSAVDGAPVVGGSIRPVTAGQPMAYVYSMALEVTDPEGHFDFPLDPGLYNLEVTAPGFATLQLQGVRVGGDDAEPHTIALEAACAIHGTVRVKGSGVPVAGAEVFLVVGGFPPSPHKTIYAVTGPDGTYRIDALAPAKINLHVRHPEYGDARLEGVAPTPGEGTPADAELGSGGVVSGRVLDATNGPVVDTDVHLFQGADFLNLRTVKTGPTGAFRFDPVTPGTWSVATGNIGSQQLSEVVQVTVAEGQVVTLDLGGPRALGQTVSGRVTRDGAPVGKVLVRLLRDGGASDSPTGRTLDDGSFAIPDVAPGHYIAIVEVHGDVAKVPLDVTADAPPAPVDLQLRAAAIAGRVLAADGTPVDGAWVTLEHVTPETAGRVLQAYNGQATTGADGSFEIAGLADGQYRLRVFHLMGTHGAALVDNLRVQGGVGVSGLEVRLQPPRAVVGRIVDTGGTPIEGAIIRVLDAAGRDFALISFNTSGSDGTYTYTGLRAELYTVVIEAKGFAPASQAVDLSTAASRVLDFRLTAGAQLRVTVHDADGAPVAGASVDLRLPSGAPVTKGVSMFNLLDGHPATDAAGIAWWRDLMPGAYRVVVVPVGGTPVEATATAVAGQVVDVAVALGG